MRKVTLKCIDSEGKEYGFHNFELASFQDSKKKKAWLSLSNDKPVSHTVKIHISAIMLHSKVLKSASLIKFR